MPSVDNTSVSPSGIGSAGDTLTRERTTVRLRTETKQRVQYWASKKNQSANEYVMEAIEDAMRRENQDYDLPTLEIVRLNQLTDEVKALSTNVANLERVVLHGLDSLIGLTRGDNYLLDEEDGEL